ncbi:MAG TPA: amidase, partial [Gemmatimonadales bacterium]
GLLASHAAKGASSRAAAEGEATSFDGQVPAGDERGIAELQAALTAGAVTSRALVEASLARIALLDRTGPALRHVLETNPDALALADASDAERRGGRVRGPLHGIPILIKDNIGTADRMETTAGSLALLGARPPADAGLVTRLRAAGAVILGKTNLSEWANIRSTHASSGWSGRGGQGRNPYALDRTPSGSSSGSAGAVAAAYCAGAIGSETDGSITSPSSCCSLVGLKPTVGLVSRSVMIPISASQDTAGPIARSVRDVAILLGAMAGADAQDPATAASAGHVHADYTGFLRADALEGARIGVPRTRLFGYSPAVDRLAEEAIAVMKRSGAVIVDPAHLDHLGEYDGTELDVLLYELKDGLNTYLAGLGTGSRPGTLADVIAFNEREREREMPYFGQELFVAAEAKGPLTDPAYRQALARNHRLARTLGINATMAKHRLDALVAPTTGAPSLIDLVNGDPGGGGSCTTPPAVAGYPHITVPMGYVRGLPAGLSFFGRAWSEPVLLGLAFAYEQATKARRPPQFLATATV